jgi:chemotaxis protein MotA
LDIATLIGLLVGLVGVLGGYLVEHGQIAMLLQLSSFMIVAGATAGATIVSFSMEDIKKLPQLMKLIFRRKSYDYIGLIERMAQLSQIARREGILALEQHEDDLEHPIIKKGLRLITDGISAELIRDMLEVEIGSIEKRHARGAKIFEVAGGYSPTMGIMGTVMSMVMIMVDLDKPETLGPKIGAAFTATLYGVGLANMVLLPFAEKLRNKSKDEILYMEIAVEGLLSIRSGESSQMVQEKLLMFLAQSRRNETDKESAA